ncbi:MAG: hypothetical protein U0R66_17615 [Mycobacterium sp.]
MDGPQADPGIEKRPNVLADRSSVDETTCLPTGMKFVMVAATTAQHCAAGATLMAALGRTSG